ncbi:MAG: hypothetical protein ACXITV_06665, partial [Luteibaculaceae bacterium]
MTVKKQLLNLIFICAVSLTLTAQVNLLQDGDFENAQITECTIEFLGINNVSNTWFSAVGPNNSSKLFGIWDTTCWAIGMMNFFDPFPPYQGEFSGWVHSTIINATNRRSLSICTESFTLEPNYEYFVTLVARRAYLRGNPLWDYSNFEMVFSDFTKNQIMASNINFFSPKDATYERYFFNVDTIDYDLGFVRLDTCINLKKEYNSLCFRFNEREEDPALWGLISQTFLPISRDQSYWIDVVEILDAKEVPGNPCKVEDHPENIVNVVLELPNIFTPNNDGVNDAFIPIEQENISIERVV